MTPLALGLMALAMLIIWGGLAVAITFLVRHPLAVEDDDGAPPVAPEAPRR